MSLKKYQTKRNFHQTSEPYGRLKGADSARRKFVVQEHHASHLHYDFRLELDGTLKSWAVPKGPSDVAGVKRLAVHVEDHPLEYGSFHGNIPKGQYGAGRVLIWDEGSWEPTENPRTAYKNGRLSFKLYGKKLRGSWTLLRMQDKKNWLLIKTKDHNAANKKNVTKADPMPKTVKPQLAVLTDKPPVTSEWIHEIKLDGYRLLTFIQNRKIKLFTRGQKDWSDRFPNIITALKKSGIENAILDGELVYLNRNKKSDFQKLQNSIEKKAETNLYYIVFDIIYYQNHSLQDLPLYQRRDILKKLLSGSDEKIIFSDHFTGDGGKILDRVCRMGQEGIVSKLKNSSYHQARTPDWVKSRCMSRQEFIICGYTSPSGSRDSFGALLLGVYNNDRLEFCGRVGTGFTRQSLKNLHKTMDKIKISRCPFSEKNIAGTDKVTWLSPRLVGEVTFTGWTADGKLRHPSFKGIRTDKPAKDIIREKPRQLPVHGHSQIHPVDVNQYPLSHPDKIMYPEQGITKNDIAGFYDSIQTWILPHVINRPLSLLRCPNGREQCFFQKHPSGKPAAGLFTVSVRETNKTRLYFYIRDFSGLLALVQMGVLEIHVWGSLINAPDKPDQVTFDLDPAPDVPWSKVITAAKIIKTFLEALKLKCFVKTTGGKGLHIVVPVVTEYTWADIKHFSRVFVDSVVAVHPQLFVASAKKSSRNGKIFIDYLRNQRGATVIAPYSIRARANAPVAVPVSWAELTTRLHSDTYSLKNLVRHLNAIKDDPWRDFFHLKQSLPYIKGDNIMASQYGKSSQKEVKKEMHRFKMGTAKSGKGGKAGPVKSKKQAVAIALSKARKKGAKVPSRASKST